jgi:hypothetical protein
MAAPESLIHDLDNPQTRVAAIVSLGEMSHAPALDKILSFAHDSDPQVRRAVMQGLAAFEGDRVMAAIIGGLHDSDESVRVAAEAAWARWVLKNILQMTGADRGYVVLKNPQTGAMEYRAGEKITAESLTTPEFNSSKIIIRETAASQHPILTNNASCDTGRASIIDYDYTLRQIVALPLKSGDEVVGVICVDINLRVGMVRNNELPALTDFVEQAVASIQHPPP